MSLELIKSPNWPFPDSGAQTYDVNSVAALSQIFYSVQRDDMDGAGFTTFDSGGFLAFHFNTVQGSPVIGSFLFIARKEFHTEGVDSIYNGAHQIDLEINLGDEYRTTTPWDIADNNGILTLQHRDIFTVKAEVTSSAVQLDVYDQQYKIPYNHPVFNFDLKAGMNPSFQLVNDTFYTAQVVITAEDGAGAVTGTAIDTFDHNLFEAKLVGGSIYGANLNDLVLREDNPGQILTKFEVPEIYLKRETFISLYIDFDFTGADLNLEAEWLDINQDPLGEPLINIPIVFDGFGIKTVAILIGTDPTGAEFLKMFISDSGDVPISTLKTFKFTDLCRGEVMMAWRNSLGAQEVRTMSILDSASVDSKQGLKYTTGGVFDLADNINPEKVLLGDSAQKYIIREGGLSKLDLVAMTEILRSPLVEIITYNTSIEAYERIEVSVVGGFSTPYNQKQRAEFEFQCTIELPPNSETLENILDYPI